MEFFNAYINNFKTKPNDRYREDVQEFMNSSWENTTLLDDIILEDIPRSFKYDNQHTVEVGIDTVSEITTSTLKIQGNYIDVTFKDCSFEYERGSMFYRPSDKSYYICYQGTNIMRTISKIKAIKCNNIIKWIDRETLEIKHYPCSLGYELSSTTSQDTKNVSVVNGRLTVLVTGNADTLNLQYNQRLIFNGVPYRINAVKNYEEDNYVDRNVNLISLYLEKTSTSIEDDLINNIANAYSNQYKVKINSENISNVKGYSDKLTAMITCNDNIVNDRQVEWKSDNENIVSITQDGVYTLNGDIGDKAKIICELSKDIFDEIEVEIVSNSQVGIELKVSPDGDLKLVETESVEFDCKLYIDGEIQDVSIDCIPSWTNNYFYTLETTDNGYKLTCINKSKDILILKFKYEEEEVEKQVNITLKGLW